MFSDLYDLFGYNETLFIAINSATNVSILPFLLQIISSLFFIGNFAVAYILLCAYFYRKIKIADDSKMSFDIIYPELVRIGTIYTIFGLSYAALKFGVNMPRPYCSLDAHNFISIMDLKNERCLSSFPSAHTALATLVTYFLWKYMHLWGKIAMCTLVIFVALSRITLAMHYPSDILYSLMIIILVVLVGNVVFYALKRSVIDPIGRRFFRILYS